MITGATGFLGSTLAKAALAHGKQVVGLKLPQDRSALIPRVEYQEGDITDPDSLTGFFEKARGRHAVLVHCAGIVSIGSDREEQVRQVNVEGTKNIVAMALRHKIGKLIYVSSVHAIRERPDGEAITEPADFSSDGVVGIYGKSKADATAHVLGAVAHGLNACTVHPSGMIGPEDRSGGYMTETIRAFWQGAFPVAITGGYDFVDVRDVAEGILSCAERGQRGGIVYPLQPVHLRAGVSIQSPGVCHKRIAQRQGEWQACVGAVGRCVGPRLGYVQNEKPPGWHPGYQPGGSGYSSM